MQKERILNYIDTWKTRCYEDIPEELHAKVEHSLRAPSYRMICRSILKNDICCTSLGYSRAKSKAVEDAKREFKSRTQPELF
jgi:predicted phosphoadenosine phosphosulfate sulfurtransferase